LFGAIGPAGPSVAGGKLGSFCTIAPGLHAPPASSHPAPAGIGFVLHISLSAVPADRANWVRFAQSARAGTGRETSNRRHGTGYCLSRRTSRSVLFSRRFWIVGTVSQYDPKKYISRRGAGTQGPKWVRSCPSLRPRASRSWRPGPRGDLDISLIRSFHHKKTFLDARLLTQKAQIPEKFSG